MRLAAGGAAMKRREPVNKDKNIPVYTAVIHTNYLKMTILIKTCNGMYSYTTNSNGSRAQFLPWLLLPISYSYR
jgi:hypothetical protein